MAEYHIPMTLVVEAEDETSAYVAAVAFERTREQFSPDAAWQWLHAGLSPEALQFVEENKARAQELQFDFGLARYALETADETEDAADAVTE